MGRRFAILSIFAALVHFIGETWWHLEFGQFLPMLIVDYIAVSLLLLGGFVLLRTGRSPGLLCGGWGFSLCLVYRALFSRVEIILSGGGSQQMEITAWVLAGMLVFAAAMFLYSMALCYEGPGSNGRNIP